MTDHRTAESGVSLAAVEQRAATQPPGADRAAVWAAGLAKSYGPTVALAGLDLHVAAGETVALLGPNGAGKTTTIGLLLGLLSPGRGQVQVCGRPPSQAVTGGLVGAMLQDAGLMPGVKVGELLTMVHGLYPRPLPLDELASIADLGPLLGRRADRLSGGQAQRVRFAAAIAGDPLLLLLDEPTAAMDVPARRNFWKQIHGYADRGRTVLFATHYLHEADDAADRIVVIASGRKIADGPPAAIKALAGGQQVRFTLLQGSRARLAALDGVRSIEHDHARVTLHTSDPDATVTSLVRSDLRWSGLEVARHAGHRPGPALQRPRRARLADHRRPGLDAAGSPGAHRLGGGQCAGRAPRLPPPHHRASQLSSSCRHRAREAQMAQPIVGWFDITGKDGPALRRVYSKLSGWSINDAGDGSGYGLAGAGEKGIGGGIGASQDGGLGGVTFYVEVDDPAAFLDRAEKLGGATVVPPAEISDFRPTFAFVADPEGHVVGLSRGAVQ